MKILGIETSCDETAAAVVEDGKIILSSVVSTSHELHQRFGGILPELASRKQLDYMLPVLTQALKEAFSHHSAFNDQLSEVDALAVTYGPGLIGSLLIGVECAKTLAFVTKKPIIPVNHVHAHIYANLLRSDDNPIQFGNNSDRIPDQVRDDGSVFPAIALVASGNHTELFLMNSISELKWLGGTIDDAAGEAFDKAARLIGFGNEGGPAIQQAARSYNPQLTTHNSQRSLPRPLLHDDTLNFSFSGLKTAIQREWKAMQNSESKIQNVNQYFAYEIQETITDVLVAKTMKAVDQHHAKSVLLGGGVAANIRLREKLHSQLTLRLRSGQATHPSTSLRASNPQLFSPPIELCTDNAASIAAYAYYHQLPQNYRIISASPSLSVEI